MENPKELIVKQFNAISGRYSAYEVFTDWIRCMAMSISNSLSMVQDKIYKEREDMYLSTISKYTDKEKTKFCEMTAWLAESLEENIEDVLGDIYMKTGMGSSAAGQFFTPFHVSELCAAMALSNYEKNAPYDYIEINEPSCGGGGMIIAAAKLLKDAGIDYQRRMKVVAQDLDWKSVYMCYVQLSLLGINAICVQGNTLSDPFDIRRTDRGHMLFTPAYMGVLI